MPCHILVPVHVPTQDVNLLVKTSTTRASCDGVFQRLQEEYAQVLGLKCGPQTAASQEYPNQPLNQTLMDKLMKVNAC